MYMWILDCDPSAKNRTLAELLILHIDAKPKSCTEDIIHNCPKELCLYSRHLADKALHSILSMETHKRNHTPALMGDQLAFLFFK